MSSVDILVPDLPESVADATVATWHKKPGDAVRRDEVLVEIETDKVVLEVPASADGILDAVLEDEGHMIGANHLPECLRIRMAQSPLAVVEDPFDVRLERLREEYFDRMYRDFIAAYGEEKGWQAYGEYLHHGLFAIRRRLGLQRFAQLTERLDEALVQQQRTASTEAHFAWLVPLLEEYYDPMYRYQLGKKAGKILFRGSWQEVAAWLAK